MAYLKGKTVVPVYYTTHQVAKFLSVSIPTVVNWINSGLLSAHRTPGGHRRISRNDIMAFARSYNYPLSSFLVDQGGGRRVLVVDDEEDFSEIVRDYLTIKGGFEVKTAKSGFEAGLTVARFHPDLIILDIRMPDMDGFAVAEMLRGDPETRSVPIIACTAYNDRETDRRVEHMAFDDYVHKPLKLDQLLDMVRTHTGADLSESQSGAARATGVDKGRGGLVLPRRTRTSSAVIDTAISAGVSAPMSNPTGARSLEMVSSSSPAAR